MIEMYLFSYYGRMEGHSVGKVGIFWLVRKFFGINIGFKDFRDNDFEVMNDPNVQNGWKCALVKP